MSLEWRSRVLQVPFVSHMILKVHQGNFQNGGGMFHMHARVLAIEQHWLCAQFFLIIKNVILKHFGIKRFLVSLDRKDALNSICQTLAFLLDMSLKHCLFFMDNLWQFEFKWPENLTEGYSPNFPGLSTKALLPAFP